MTVFLILSSLGVAFYFILLLELYRDRRRRSHDRTETFRQLEFGRYDDSGWVASHNTLTPEESSLQFSDEILWLPVTKVHWKPAPAPMHSQHRETTSIAVAAPSRGHAAQS